MAATSTSIETRPSLRRRIVAAGTWSLFGFGVGQGIRLTSNLIMTRILVPEMFGLMALATVMMIGITMSMDIGLRQSVVRSNRGSEPHFLNTIWLLQIGRGIVIAALGAGVSVVLLAATALGITSPATIYSDPQLPRVVLALAIAAAIGGFESTKQFEATRELQVGRLTKIELMAQIASLSVMLTWVSIDKSIWALVAGNVASVVLRVVLTHTVLPGTSNSFSWDEGAFKEILSIGKWIFPSSSIGFVANNGDRLLIGAFVAPAVLGVYTIAFFVMNAVEQIFSRLTSEVLFPSLSEIARERPRALATAYYKARWAIGVPTTFCAGFLAATGQALVKLLYDTRYSDAGWMLQMLAVCLVTVQFQVAGQCFIALGNVRPLLVLAITRAVGVVAFVPVGFAIHGLEGALCGLVLSYLSPIPVALYYKYRFGLLSVAKEAVFVPVFVIGALIGIAALHLMPTWGR